MAMSWKDLTDKRRLVKSWKQSSGMRIPAQQITTIIRVIKEKWNHVNVKEKRFEAFTKHQLSGISNDMILHHKLPLLPRLSILILRFWVLTFCTKCWPLRFNAVKWKKNCTCFSIHMQWIYYRIKEKLRWLCESCAAFFVFFCSFLCSLFLLCLIAKENYIDIYTTCVFMILQAWMSSKMYQYH